MSYGGGKADGCASKGWQPQRLSCACTATENIGFRGCKLCYLLPQVQITAKQFTVQANMRHDEPLIRAMLILP